MAKKGVDSYVKSMLKKGYDVSSVRNELLKNGYSSSEIDEAIKSSYVKHEIHLSKTTAAVIVFAFISLIVAASLYYFGPQKAASKLLDINLEPVSTTAAAGNEIVFIKELSNLGSAQRYDVIIQQEIIEPKTNRIVTQKIETRAIETFGSTQTRILIPSDTKPGDYILRAIVEYDGKKAVATLPVKIVAPSQEGTCFDKIKNQNEEGIDCGGACNPCQQRELQCNDFNPCTIDAEENGDCTNKEIVPCCGNNVCEENEQGCADCIRNEQNLPTSETLDTIREIAKTDPGKAFQQCSKMQVPDLKDTCISNIAEAQSSKTYCSQISSARIKDLCLSGIAQSLNDNTICDEISTEARKDSCYSNFFIFAKDYSICPKISNKALRESCEQLRQAEEYNKEINQMQSQDAAQ